MDPIDEYREIVKQTIADYARYKPSYGDIDSEMVLDDQSDHYELLPQQDRQYTGFAVS